jgi:hypothetical protein
VTPASSPCEITRGQEARATREADESRAPRPCEVVEPDDRAPTGSEPTAAELIAVEPVAVEPVAVEPVSDRDAPTVTNEASNLVPARGPASVGQGSAESTPGPIEGPPGPEADGPAACRSTGAEPDDRGRIATNEAICESREVERAGADSVSGEPPPIPLTVDVARSGPSYCTSSSTTVTRRLGRSSWGGGWR